MKTSQIFFCIICLMGTFAYAELLHIPDDFSTIQQGINASVNGDTVLVAPGTYYENINFNGRSIVVASYYLSTGDTSYIAQTVIDGSQSGTVVTIASGEDSTTTLCGLVITNGRDSNESDDKGASGIVCRNASNANLTHLKVEQNYLERNYRYKAGGIGCFESSVLNIDNVKIRDNEQRGVTCQDSSTLRIIHSDFSNNSGRYGGGIFCQKSQIELDNVTLRNHLLGSYGGGGICMEFSKIKITNVKIENNSWKSYSSASLGPSLRGAGIYARGSDLEIDSTLVKDNLGMGSIPGLGLGCGIYLLNSNAEIRNSWFIKNRSLVDSRNIYGGGIYCSDSSIVILKNCIVSENSGDYGGGIFVQSSNMTLDHTVISENYATGLGGAIYNDNSVLTLRNTSINRNISEKSGGGIYCTNENANLIFDGSELNSVYYNRAFVTGNDFASDGKSTISAVLDTFTTSHKDSVFIDPIENHNISWQKTLVEPVSADLFVSEQGSDENNGLSSNQPMKTLNKALLSIQVDSLNPRVIHVAPGLYSPSKTGETFPVLCKSYVSILGDGPNSTILDAEQQNQVVQLYIVNNMFFQGFTLCNGETNNDGGGINTFRSNNVIFKDLVISNNTAFCSGGGIYCSVIYLSSLYKISFENVLVHNNKCDRYGGGICLRRGEYILENVTVYDNIYFNASSNIYGEINHAGGLVLSMGSKVNLINSIIANNQPYNIISSTTPPLGGDNILTVLSSNIQGGRDSIKDVYDNSIINWLDGNIDADPLFVGGDPFDYHLSGDSPCIDAGTVFYEWEGDTLVNMEESEYSGPAPDMGAYEYGVLNRIESESVPLRFELEQNYPNPFNPVTQISYQLPHPDRVRLTVYDVLGREVKALLDADRPAGIHAIQWDGWDVSGKTVAAGVYFYRIEAGGFNRVKKMVLLR